MYRLILFATILFTLTSCKTVLFDGVPGTEQKEFPSTLQGTYHAVWKSGFGFNRQFKDTLVIELGPTKYTIKDSSDIIVSDLDEAHRLRLLENKYYVLATKDVNFSNYWNYFFIEQTKKGIKVSGIMENGSSVPVAESLSRNFVQLNNAGDSVFVYKTNDPQLLSLYEKHVRKYALELIRMNKQESRRDSM